MLKMYEDTKNTLPLLNKKNSEFNWHYLHETLKSAIKLGDKNSLDDKVVNVLKNGKRVYFRENKWLFDVGGLEPIMALNFMPKSGKLPPELEVEVKLIALILVYFSNNHLYLSSVKASTSLTIKVAKSLEQNAISSFSELTAEKIQELSNLPNFLYLNSRRTLVAISNFNRCRAFLPSKFAKYGIDLKNIRQKEHAPIKQFLVIPPRLYFKLLSEFSAEIEMYYRFRKVISENMSDSLREFDELEDSQIEMIINGQIPFEKNLPNNFLRKLKKRNITIEELNAQEIKTLLREESLTVRIPYRKARPLSLGQNKFKNQVDFRQFLNRLNYICSFMCIALSGMRISELLRMDPQYGVQSEVIDGQRIVLFTTKQSKVTLNSQTRDDVYVTTELGEKAFELLRAINLPMKAWVEKNTGEVKKGLMYNTGRISLQHPTTRHALANSMRNFIKKQLGSHSAYTIDDISFLAISNPTRQFNEGDKFNFNPHQLRRSLAYYLVGYELATYPQLKQQYSHFSLAMTMWYARYAMSFNKMYREINEQRIDAKSKIFAGCYEKMANRERIAGGLFKQQTKGLDEVTLSQFIKGKNNRNLSADYWKNEIKSGKVHIHAIAPGMYCTNTACSMRVNVDLAECIDCEFDIIENANYAESRRLTASRNILYYSTSKTKVSINMLYKWLSDIRASEKIMLDMGLSYEKFQLPSNIAKLLIKTKQK
jgi:integrase